MSVSATLMVAMLMATCGYAAEAQAEDPQTEEVQTEEVQAEERLAEARLAENALAAGDAVKTLTAIDPDCLAIETSFARYDLNRLAALTPAAPRWRAQQAFRLAAAHLADDDRRAAGVVLKDSLPGLNKALKQDPDNVELLLLAVMLDGQYVLVNRWRFLHNGLRGLRRMNRAAELDPANPRLALIEGTAKLLMPAVLGGSGSEAITTFEAARRDTALCADGEWAQVDILTWLGRAHQEAGEEALANAVFTAARALDPENHWLARELAGGGYEWQDAEHFQAPN
ncbi:MAG: hypothetical protein AAGE43_02910 [Pseudomonadota bacterium]